MLIWTFLMSLVEELLSDNYADERRSQLIGKRAGNYNAGEISAGETIYMTVADKDGNDGFADSK